MNQNQRLTDLFRKHLDKTISLSEKEELFELINETGNDEQVKELIADSWSKDFLLHEQNSDRANIIFKNILAYKGKATVRKIAIWKYAAAAAIVLLLASSAWLLFNNNKRSVKPGLATNDQPLKDILPGREGAVLTLDNGSKIVLDTAGNGKLVQQGSSTINKSNNQLSYEASGKGLNIVYNTVSTPNGRQFTLVLADGSKVWLNAGSSIRFPSSFTGRERRVEVTGEAYFEVAKNKRMPFRVQANRMLVEVLGTHFNINAYNDEPVATTTLLEGAVKVSHEGKTIHLEPGQQSMLDNDGNLASRSNINTDEVTAWKDGIFHFESADLPTILRQFSRWYDVEVSYEGKVSNDTYFVIVKRNSTLLSVLKALQASDVEFRVEGKKLVVATK
jgi:transmembrane sensor